jgi:MarR family transcriptional regulator for hemolysin
MQRSKAAFDWDPGDNPAYLLGRAARLFTRKADERLRKHGFGAAHIPVLKALKDGVAMSQTELATLARIEQPTMAQMLARMERDGVVRRTPNPEDGRSSLFSLTARSLAKVAAARGVLVQGSEEMLAGFSAAEVAQLGALLLRVIANLEDE